MKLDNPFPQSVRLLFLYNYACFNCGRSDRGLELHHIWGRISASALNACPLCTVCHGAVVHTRDEHHHLLRRVINFLWRNGYRLLPVDDVFLKTVENDLRGFTL
jgi:hypothetical protein